MVLHAATIARQRQRDHRPTLIEVISAVRMRGREKFLPEG
jgi:hypothetical protein